MKPLLACLAVLLILTISAEGRPRKRKSILERVGSLADQALVKPPADLETCFSPDEPCDVKLLKFMDTAKRSIDVAIYDITLDQIAHHLLAQAISKKLTVRIVVDRKQAKGAHSLVKTLVKGGAEIRYGHQRGIMHNKFTIIDGSRVETGSFNYTNHATESNSENQIYLGEPAVVQRYQKRFEKLWAEGDPVALTGAN